VLLASCKVKVRDRVADLVGMSELSGLVVLPILLIPECLRVEGRAGWGGPAGKNRESDKGGNDGLHNSSPGVVMPSRPRGYISSKIQCRRCLFPSEPALQVTNPSQERQGIKGCSLDIDLQKR
jgi:hypothetical protein